MKKTILLLLALFMAFGCSKSCSRAEITKIDHASVFFKAPQDEAVLTSPIEVVFGVAGMKVRPALEDINDKTTGHYHLLIDDPKGYVEKGQKIRSDERHISMAKGENQMSLMLIPGAHTLTVQFADGAGLSYGKDMAQTIKVTVVEFTEDDGSD